MEDNLESGSGRHVAADKTSSSLWGRIQDRVGDSLSKLLKGRQIHAKSRASRPYSHDAKLIAASISAVAVALFFVGITVHRQNGVLTKASLKLQKAAENIKNAVPTKIGMTTKLLPPAPVYQQPIYVPRQNFMNEQRFQRRPSPQFRSVNRGDTIKSRKELLRRRDNAERRRSKVAKKSRSKIKRDFLDDPQHEVANQKRKSKRSMSAKYIDVEE